MRSYTTAGNQPFFNQRQLARNFDPVSSVSSYIKKTIVLLTFLMSISFLSDAQTVTSVTTSKPNGSYKEGTSIIIRVNFSQAMKIDGTKTITLTLETGTNDAVVTYTGGNASTVNFIEFDYVVAATHTSSDLNYQSTSALVAEANGIEVDGMGNTTDLNTTLPALNNANSLAGTGLGNGADIIIDTTAPTNQNTIFPTGVSKQGSATVTLVAGSAANFNWFAPAATVNFVANGTTITTAAGNATSITAPSDEGDYKLFVLDAAGNASSASTATLSVDNTPPPTPTVPALTTDTGLSGSDKITNDNTPSFNVTGTSGNKLELLNGSTVLATIASANGAVQSMTSSTLTDGTYSIKARTTDAAGNTAESAELTDVVIDTDPPGISSITPFATRTRGLIAKTGSITVTNGSATVTTADAQFQTNLFVGAILRRPDDTAIGTVLSIESETSLTLTANASSDYSGSYAIQFYFTATFDEPMNSSTILAADFAESGTGTLGSVVPVTQGGGKSSAFYVHVSSLIGDNGATQINLTGDGRQDVAGNSANATFNGGTATVDNAGPTVSSIVRTTPSQAYTKATSVTFTVTFNEAAFNVDALDFNKAISGAGFSAGAVSVTPISSTVYEVTVDGISTVTGTLEIEVPSNATITDDLGNAFSVAYTSGEVYNFDYTNPAQPAVYNAVTTRGNVVANYWNGTNLGGTNQGVNLSLGIPNDPTLEGGTIQVQARISSGTFATITTVTSLAIAQGDLGTTKVITIDDSQILAITGYAQTVQLEFQARFVDLVGNAGPYRQSTNSLTVDTIAPSIVGTPVYSANGSARETIVITFDESLTIPNGALPVRTGTQGNPGFYSNDPSIDNDNTYTFYTSANKTITLSSSSHNQWTDPASQIITYTSNIGVAGNYVRDAAGNEMGTQDITTTVPAPLLASSMVLNPNGTNGEIITFTVDQALTTPTTDNGVIGISVNGVNPGLTTFTATYSTANSVNTIILVAINNNTWDETAVVSYVGAAGNIQNSAGDLAAFSEQILVGPITIESENIYDVTLAKVDDPIIVSFSINKPLLSLSGPPTATIGTLPAVVAIDGSYPNYTATVTATSAIATGPVSFSIEVLEAGRTTTVNTTIPGSSVLFDKMQPTVTVNDDHPDNIVRDADVVRITATFIDANGINETSKPKISIGSFVTNAEMIKITNLVWYYDWDVPAGSNNDGDVSVTISATDPAGNLNESATAEPVTGTLTYTIDNTPPEVTIAITTPPTILGFGTNATTATDVSFLLTFNQTIPSTVNPIDITVNTDSDVSLSDAYPGVTYTNIFVTGSGSTRTVTLTGLAGTGRIKINFLDADNNVTDEAGNPVVDKTTTFSTNQFYTRVLPAPSNTVASVSVSRTATTMTVNWTDAVAPAQQATHYLVMIKKTTQPSFPDPVDGTYVNNDTDISDDNYQRLNITLGGTSALFSNLSASENYDVIIYPYTLSPNNATSNINFGQDKSTQVSGTSNIVQNFNYSGNDNILYKDFTTAALTSSSKTLEQFDLRDGGGIADGDNLPTILTGITLNINNWENLNTLGLFNGSTLVQQITVTGPTAVFNSIGTTFQAADGTTPATITVKGSFKTTVDDNEVITFNVTSVTAASSNSSQFLTTTPTGPTVASDATGTQNKIEVVATKIDFTTVPASASINVPITVQVSARDANNNLDADYNGPITDSGNTDEANFTTINNPTGNFAGGIYNYPATFQFTEGNGNVSLTIIGDDGNLANNIDASGPISGTSPLISVLSSFDSWLYFDPTFTYTNRINFVTDDNQASSTSSTSQKLARLILSDGGSSVSTATASNPVPGKKNQPFGSHHDEDGAFTQISDFTISVTNPGRFQAIALFASDGTTKISETVYPNITGSVTFNGLGTNAYRANDNDVNTFYIMATFRPNAIDQEQITMQITNVTHDAGSRFAEQKIPPPAITYVAGVDGNGVFGDSSDGTVNYLDVITTKFDFIQSPPRYAGINEPVPLSGTPEIKIEAHDKFNNLDTEFNNTTTVTAVSANVSPGATTFANGILLLPSSTFRYTTPGNGKLTVSFNAITSNVPGAVPCGPVDVIHVTAVENQSNGVSLVESLKGGTTNNRIFGITFQVPHSDVANSEPLLEEFSITFKNDDGDPYPYYTTGSTIFKNFKIFKSINGAAPTPTTGDLTITETASEKLKSINPATTSKDMVKVTFTNKPTLYDGKTYTFYLSVDVDVNVSVGTPPITPYLEDEGYTLPIINYTNDHILISEGSTVANVKGITRKFASTKPPVLVKTTPDNGTLNVRKDVEYVEVHFDVPVVTFDGKAFLFKRDNPTDTVAVLTAANGLFVDSETLTAAEAIKTQVVDSIRFLLPLDLPDLEADEVYFITIPKGRFSNIDNKDRAGISDEGFNLFGGITYNGTFYFKVGSDLPPNLLSSNNDKYFYTATTTTFNTSFDQEGKAYYMVVTSTNGTPPTVTKNQILGTETYSATTVIERGSYKISQTSPNFQYATTNATLTAGVDYWVYLFAENDRVPIPVQTDAPYGGFIDDGATQDPTNDYVVGGPGPTLVLNKPASATTNRYSNPSYTICSNSSVKLQEPIIISELSVSEFNGVGTQTINLLLPSGFQFDITKEPVFTGNGSDFVTWPADQKRFRYINTTFMEISFENTGVSSLDNIMISDIYVIASSNDVSGKIERFAGSGLLSIVPTGTQLATISSIPASAITFTNTYSEANSFDSDPLFIENTVTYIPDNYVDANGTATIRLIPVIEPGVRDYGASLFSGSGLTDDILTLSAVSLNSAFNITLTHTDQNGCVSNTIGQYAVYDHTAAIPELLPDPDNDKDIRVAISNENFPNNPPSLKDPTQVVSYVGLAGYQLLDLYTNVPAKATAITDPANFANNKPTDQIIFGTNWSNLVKYIPVPVEFVLSDNLSSPGNDVFYKSYNWDYTAILHNDSLAKYSIPNPYVTYFERLTLDRTATSGATIPGQKYYTGGSLGIVEFTGKYQSTADFSVFVPFKQEVEVFVPAIPVIEVSGESSFQGSTPVFCETTSGNILISGYPAASSTSRGSFALYDSASYNPNTPDDINAIIYKAGTSKTPAGFVDNANGTANLNVGQIFNAYRTIRIEYTYQDNNSPAIGTGAGYIRVTPNPVANFTTSNLCEDITINFSDASSFAAASGVNIAKWDWNFNDINATGTNPNTETIQNPVHFYREPLDYPNVSLVVTTNFGCPSTANQKTLSIGGTPEVKFDFLGVSTADLIEFVSTSTVTNDNISTQTWDFGDGTTDVGSSVDHIYGTANLYKPKLTVLTEKGCLNNRSRNLIILPRVVVTDDNVYSQNFETTNGEWRPYPENATWQWAAADKSVIKNDPAINGQKVWITNATGAYDTESFLYTASYDISELTRPMLSLNSNVQMGQGDGVVIEYSTDNKNASDSTKVWTRLGTNETGINWYNEQGLPSNPGNQVGGDFGWARPSNNWQESKHSLSVNGLTNDAEKEKVVFRFALASVSNRTSDGFALDNVRLGNRTRTVLIENFTNKGGSNPDEKQVSDYLKTFIGSVGTEIVKINYHVGFPGPATDPFNVINPADPSARALYYNVVKTPTTFMDGLTDKSDPLFTNWAQSKYDSQSLNLAAADIAIAQTLSSTTGAYSVEVSVKANKQLPANTILHVAFLEKDIALSNNLPTGENEFEYVLKKLLPSASGSRFNAVLNENQTLTFTDLEWTPDTKTLFAPSDDLVLVAFLQNEETLEIYQSELIEGISDPPVVTGIGDILPGLVNVYPNPASGEFRVELPAFVQNEAEMYLIDLMGRKHEAGKIKAGSNAASVNVETLSEGIYILEIGSEKTGIVRKKIMVVMKN